MPLDYQWIEQSSPPELWTEVQEVQAAKRRCLTLEVILLFLASALIPFWYQSRGATKFGATVAIQNMNTSSDKLINLMAHRQREGFECQSSLDIGEIAKPWQMLVALARLYRFFCFCLFQST